MKRKIALIICILFLCGCDGSTSENIPSVPTNDIPDIIESAESPDTRETIQPATEPEIGSDDSERITPKLSPEKIAYTLSAAVSTDKINVSVGFDIDFDPTVLYYYEVCAEIAESSCDGEELEELRAHNYLVKGYPSFYYMGTDEADWLATVSYGLWTTEGDCLERLFLVKDGEIVRELEPIQDWILASYYSYGELYHAGADKGLYKTDLGTGESRLVLEQDGRAIITAMNEDYIVYGSSMQQIVIRDTREIIYPDINWDGMSLSYLPFILSDDTIDYKDWQGEYHSYDIKSRTMTNGDRHNLVKIKGYDYTDKWSVTVEDSGIPAIRVVNLYDGTERVYDLRALIGEVSGEELFRHNTEYIIDGDRLWLYNWNDLFSFVLNLETGEAAEAEIGLIKRSNAFISEGKFKVMEDDILYAADVDYPV